MKWTCWIAAAILCCGTVTADAGLFGLFGKKGGGLCHKNDCCPEACCEEECCEQPTCCAPAECCEQPSCCAPEECCEEDCCEDCASTGCCLGKKRGGLLSKLFGCFKKKHHQGCCEEGCCEEECCPSCCAPECCAPACGVPAGQCAH